MLLHSDRGIGNDTPDSIEGTTVKTVSCISILYCGAKCNNYSDRSNTHSSSASNIFIAPSYQFFDRTQTHPSRWKIIITLCKTKMSITFLWKSSQTLKFNVISVTHKYLSPALYNQCTDHSIVVRLHNKGPSTSKCILKPKKSYYLLMQVRTHGPTLCP